jgi:hypothetical protein
MRGGDEEMRGEIGEVKEITRTITLQIPDDVYQFLVQTARLTRRTPEDLAAQWLANSIGTAVTDPVEKFIGAFPTDIPDWADEHDKYINGAAN